MKKIKLLILVSGSGSGSGSNAAAIVRAMQLDRVEITIGCNISRESCKAGIWERNLGVPIYHLPSPGKDFSALKKHLLENDYDLVVLAGYMRVLPPDIIELIEEKAINIHPSLLPLYKGSEDGYADAFNNKDEYSGCTVHFVTNEVDGGEIVAQVKFKIPEEAKENLDLLKEIGLHFEHQIYPQVILAYLGKIAKISITIRADWKYKIEDVSFTITEKVL